MGRRGRKRQLEVESRYWQLLLSGTGTVEACRLVGITRKTGYRWRAENGGVPPARLAEAARSIRCLSRLERQRIATLRERGLGVREIARRLDRAPSTISREVRRNLRPYDRDRYDADLAHARAAQRARRPRPGRLVLDGELGRLAQAGSVASGEAGRSPRGADRFTRTLRHAPAPVEVTTDKAGPYQRVLDELLPTALHVTEQYANNRVKPIMLG